MRAVLVVALLVGTGWAQAQAPELTVEAIFAEAGLTGRPPETVRWSPDGTKVSYILRDDSGERGELWYVDLATGKPAVLVGAEKLASQAADARLSERERERRIRYAVARYHWAPDSRHILFDSKGQLWLYSLETGTAVQITSAPEPTSDPKFSPDGSQVAYLQKHTLHVHSVASTRQVVLSHDGDNNVLNGEVDWVYGEELDVRSNYFWAPNGKQILFLQMNETPVPTYPITDLIPTHPTVDLQKYPKAGDPNPVVRLGVMNVSGGKVNWLILPPQRPAPDPVGTRPREAQDLYIPRFGWVRDGVVWAQVLNRMQNQLDLYFVEVSSGRSVLVLSEQNRAWVEVKDNFTLLRSGDRFLWSSWRDGHTHLYLYSFDKTGPLPTYARMERQLTQGSFEVFNVEAVDEEAGVVYFTANEGDARQQHLYGVRLDGGGFQRVTREAGVHQPFFGPSPKHYVDNFSALMTPPRFSLCRLGGECRKFWESRSLDAYKLTAPAFVDFRADDGTVLYGLLLLPPAASAPGVKVPLVLNPYGGPGAQLVRNAWGGDSFLFHQVLARVGIAVLQVDNRGTAGRGLAFASVLRRSLGEVELKDQLTALKQALAAYPVLDKDRVGFWGWSYGGTMTLWALTRSAAFKAGVAVAPVTDWRDYDSVYTERYLGLPRENPQGYARSSPITTADSLHGSLLLVHGTGDDNVHLQNTIQMTQAFINAGHTFELMLYPRKTHSIAGASARIDLFTRIQQYFETELPGRKP